MPNLHPVDVAVIPTVLAVPCKRHQAKPNEPCWSSPRAVCGSRIRARGVRR